MKRLPLMAAAALAAAGCGGGAATPAGPGRPSHAACLSPHALGATVARSNSDRLTPVALCPRPRVAPLHPVRMTVVVGGRTPQVYAAVAPLLRIRGRMVTLACEVILTSLPAAGCSGVPVTGVDIRPIPEVSHIGGTWETRPLRLTGTWDGHSLHVTAPPAPSSTSPAPSPPMRCRVPSTSFASALANRIGAHHAGLPVLETSACGSTAWVLVAVADAPTVSAIHHRFGARVIVSGWLRPARPQ